MKINIAGRNYSFKFYHKNDGDTSSKLSSNKVPNTPLERATICIIFDEDGVELTSGVTNVHPTDNFCKEKGRQISLKRAMNTWKKEVRAQVWEEYRTWGAKPRW